MEAVFSHVSLFPPNTNNITRETDPENIKIILIYFFIGYDQIFKLLKFRTKMSTYNILILK